MEETIPLKRRRLTLIKSMLYRLPICFMSLFVITRRVGLSSSHVFVCHYSKDKLKIQLTNFMIGNLFLINKCIFKASKKLHIWELEGGNFYIE